LGILHYKQLTWLEGQALYSAGRKSRPWLEEEMSDFEKKGTIMLPLKLAENQASALCKKSAQAH
jgi:hypothetical protein